MASIQGMAAAHGALEQPIIRQITTQDISDALHAGLEDFKAKPSHYVFMGLIYPVAGIVLIAWSIGVALLPMIYPLMSGFALVGPILALGLYEISRRREMGEDTSWHHAFEVRHSPALPSIIAMSAFLVGLFVAWLVAAQWLYFLSFGDLAPASFLRFAADVMEAPGGWALIIWGNLIGFVFALVALATSIVAFPLMLDRKVSVAVAIETSLRVTIANPVPVLLWGLVVAIALLVGMATILVGLAVIVPILGHATWHLYRNLIEPLPVPAQLRTLKPRSSRIAKTASGKGQSAA